MGPEFARPWSWPYHGTMGTRWTRYSLLILFLFGATSAHAGLVGEPYVGYGAAKVDETLSAAGAPTVTDTVKPKGLVYGARAGWGFAFASVGAMYQGSGMTALGGAVKFNASDIGIYFGAFPPGGRLWLTYVISSKAGGVSGTGWKVGLGKTFGPVSVNAEYHKWSYSGVSTHSGDTISLSASSKADYSASASAFVLSLGVPLGFGPMRP